MFLRMFSACVSVIAAFLALVGSASIMSRVFSSDWLTGVWIALLGCAILSAVCAVVSKASEINLHNTSVYRTPNNRPEIRTILDRYALFLAGGWDDDQTRK